MIERLPPPLRSLLHVRHGGKEHDGCRKFLPRNEIAEESPLTRDHIMALFPPLLSVQNLVLSSSTTRRRDASNESLQPLFPLATRNDGELKIVRHARGKASAAVREKGTTVKSWTAHKEVRACSNLAYDPRHFLAVPLIQQGATSRTSTSHEA